MRLSQDEAQELSMLLFLAREQVAMWADVVERRVGIRDTTVDKIRDSIDAYRARFGWDPDGIGGEGPVETNERA